MKTELFKTEDGSHSLFVPELDEQYHSVHGAVNEALHVYINPAFNYCQKNSLSVLEIGFGTGLNTHLTAIEAAKTNRSVYYQSLELYPLDSNIIKELNYSDLLGNHYLFSSLHEAEWNKEVEITDTFTLHKVETDLTTYIYNRKFDVVYFDAFGPDKQPELWTPEIFERIYNALNDGGVLTTYSAKGVVKRTLKALGLNVELIPGPKGKREMIRAKKLII